MQAVQYMNINLFYLCVKVKIRGEGLSALTNRGRDISVSAAACGCGTLYSFCRENWKVISSGNGEEAGDYSVFVSEKEIIPQYLQIIRINRRNTVFASETLKKRTLLFTVLRQKDRKAVTIIL